MPSLMELVERVNKGELIEAEQLEVYQESANSAEKFLAHHANAMLDLRRAQQHMMQSLEAIDYSDQKVLNQFVSVSGFLGLTDLRCGPIVKFGSCAIARREYGLGVEAIQNAVAYDLQHGGAYTSDRENCQFIATQYDRAAQCVGWTNPLPGEWNNKQTKIAYVVSSIVDDDTTGRTIQSLAKNCDSKRFRLQVYSTEAGVRRDRQQFSQTSYVASSAKRGLQTMEALTKLKVGTFLAPTDSDVVTAAKELANQLAADRIDVIIFDVTQADPIASLIAQWNVGRVKINLSRRSPMYMSGIHCVTYVDQVKFDLDKDFWNRKNTDSKFILEGIDLEENLGTAPQRATYGIPDSAVVLATAGNELDKTVGEEFVDSIINILRSHPHAIYLLIGEAELASQKRKFESAGVGKRVGYAGKRKDLPGFLRIADLYLAEFPGSGATGVLQAMSVAKPVVAMRCGESSDQSQAAALVGSEATISGRDAGAYIERVSKLIRETTYRNKLGKTMRSRVEQHFGYNQTARHLEQLCDQLIQLRSESVPAIDLDLDDRDDAIAQVA
ncbi:hypothetical protein BH09PLA1_BH09PLA1_21410 [soil metagenome]